MSQDDDWAPSSELLRDYQDPGTPPGTLRPAEGESGPSRIVVARYNADDASIIEVADLSALETLRGDGRVHWVHVVGLADIALIEHLRLFAIMARGRLQELDA